MKLSPKKILDTKFEAVISGYSPTKVDQFLDLIVSDYKEMIQENNQLKKLTKELENQLKACEAEVKTLKSTLASTNETIQNHDGTGLLIIEAKE